MILSTTAVLLALAGAARGEETRDLYDSAIAKFKKGDLDGAMADVGKTIALKPELADPYVIRGNIREAKGGPGGGIRRFQQSH